MTAGGSKRVLPFTRSVRSADRQDKPSDRSSASAGVVQGWTSVYELRITLRDVAPPIWRRVLVPGTTDLAALHALIQAAMGWAPESAHHGGTGEWIARTVGPDLPPTDLDEERASTLRDVLKTPGDSFIYASGLGDEWIHVVEVEDIRPGIAAGAQALCVGGARACPPEDSEGPASYAEFLAALRDPFHEQHAEAVESVEGRFDPEHFDVDEVNARLARLQRL
jgi:hypothetical protein